MIRSRQRRARRRFLNNSSYHVIGIVIDLLLLRAVRRDLPGLVPQRCRDRRCRRCRPGR